MKKILLISIALSLELLAASCSGDKRVDAALQSADRLIFEAPDSAAAMLCDLDLAEASRGQRARHALLLTKARDKAYIDIPDDSLIKIAADYYRGRGDSLEVQSLYYLGTILNRQCLYPESLISLMEASDRTKAIGDYFYLAMAYREQVAVYTKLLEFDRAASLGEKAVEAFNRAHRPLHAAWARVYIPQSLAYSGEIDAASDSIKALETDSLIQSEQYLRQDFLYIATNVCYKSGEFEQSENYFDAYLRAGGAPPSKMLSQMAKLSLSKGDKDKARLYYDLAVSSRQDKADSLAAGWVYAKLLASGGDYRNAFLLQEDLHYAVDRQANSLIAHPYTALLNDYFCSEANQQASLREKAELKTMITILIALLLSGVMIALIVYYRHTLSRKAAERAALLNDIRRTESQVSLLLDKQKALSSEKAFSMSLLNSICEARIAMLSTGDAMQRFGKNISEIIINLTSPKNMSAMEELIDSSTDNLMSRFIAKVPGVTAKERIVAVFVFLGFSNSSIASIMQYKSTTNVRQLRHKIKGRILSNPTDDSKLFLSYFDTPANK